jgi:predicted amidophosphoribosyltransferase
VQFRAILDFVFPAQCGGCEALGSGLCDRCLPSVPVIQRRLPSLEITALGAYDGGLRRAILALKNGRRDVAEAFALRLAPWIDSDTAIVPVPTTAARRRQRGFDGCELIASLACESRTPVFAALAQVRGETQRGRGRDARLKARTRFVWRAKQLNGERIVLLDDVVTTGATLEDCASVVRAARGIVRKAIVIASA